MADHPIQSLMQTAMENIKEMVDVNTIIGEPVETSDGQVIIPVSKVGFGFAAGGSEFRTSQINEKASSGKEDKKESSDTKYPFGGGSGGGVSITPVAFIVVGKEGVRLLNVEGSTHLLDRVIDMAPSLMKQLKGKKKNDDCDV
ncbi:GerW family sporulation protein [Hazenella sp. IB182357]|uniref:GerW family sporulation protein n=1 Tax=Polycladospora coralii TaxID=2771432 RepID=A0A926N9Z9_9BACL|nr:GerW family sporulation protein [Polycladospora coralii]MBD1372951.1 GerW family sporulation protein [Polycladospora coralii]MBS7530992.1 GerW family sporulation protein [Polycladospora coralii]